MSDIERVVRASRRLENILAKHYGATGRGLHGLISSAASKLPTRTVKSLRWVATMRNKVVHEEGFRLSDPKGFSKEVKRLEKELQPGGSARALPFFLSLVILALALATVALL